MSTAGMTVSTPPTPPTGSFHEVQSFLRNRVVWWVLVGSFVFALGVVVLATVAENAAFDALLWTTLGMIGVTVLVARMGIVTEVAPDGLRVRLWPIPFKTYTWDAIASAETRTYKPLREYGGWGLRWGPSGKAYNAAGTEGVQLVLKDGKRVLIGSQRAAELEAAIRAYVR